MQFEFKKIICKHFNIKYLIIFFQDNSNVISTNHSKVTLFINGEEYQVVSILIKKELQYLFLQQTVVVLLASQLPH